MKNKTRYYVSIFDNELNTYLYKYIYYVKNATPLKIRRKTWFCTSQIVDY